jgi:hypothetical protein
MVKSGGQARLILLRQWLTDHQEVIGPMKRIDKFPTLGSLREVGND